jgi:hypothetical protein
MPHGEPDARPAPSQHAETAGAGEVARAIAPAAAPDLRAFASAAGNAAMTRSLTGLQRARGNDGVARMLARDAAGTQGGGQSTGGGAAPAAGDGKQPAKGLILPDDAQDVAPHQMKRSAFVAQLRGAVNAAAESALAGSGWGTLMRGAAMAQLESRLQGYEKLDAGALEAAIRADAPGASGAASAAALIPPVAQAVGAAVAEGLPHEEPPAAELAGGLLGAVKGLLFKRRGSGGATPEDPLAVRGQLGPGEPLPGGVAGRIGGVLGDSFSDVRIHTDARAARAADDVGARAFTVGSSVAFGAGEYRPGTIVGDALLAHELAHVVQQRSAAPELAAAHAGAGDAALEHDADEVAAVAVAALHAGAPARPSLARLRSGLRLSRCGGVGSTVTKTMKQANTGGGVWYWPNFRAACEKGEVPFTWNEAKYRYGWSQTDQLEKTDVFTWRLTSKSASSALRAWFTGVTVADCASVATASYYNGILEKVGAEKFDAYFAVGKNTMVIGQYPDETPLKRFMIETNSAVLKEGDWYYFANHPAYKYKHPAGLWQGENAMYLGNDQWSGFGATKSRDAMEEELVAQFKEGRSGDDNKKLEGNDLPFKEKRLEDGSLPKAFRMEGEQGPDGGGTIPVEMDVKKMKAAGGGLQATGWRLSEKRIEKVFDK